MRWQRRLEARLTALIQDPDLADLGLEGATLAVQIAELPYAFWICVQDRSVRLTTTPSGAPPTVLIEGTLQALAQSARRKRPQGGLRISGTLQVLEGFVRLGEVFFEDWQAVLEPYIGGIGAYAFRQSVDQIWKQVRWVAWDLITDQVRFAQRAEGILPDRSAFLAFARAVRALEGAVERVSRDVMEDQG